MIAVPATVRLGAIHSVLCGGVAAHSLASRIEDATPKVTVSADAGSRGGEVIPTKACRFGRRCGVVEAR
jgi:propionyl-CoA synthetase